MEMRFSTREAYFLYACILFFLGFFFCAGLYLGKTQLRDVEPEAQADSVPEKPEENLKTQLDFYEDLSKPTAESTAAEETAQEAILRDEENSEPVTIPVDPVESLEAGGTTADKKGFTIQVAAHSKLEEAQNVLIRLEAKGFECQIHAPAAGDSDQFYRIWVGEFVSIEEASSVEGRLRQEGFHTYIRPRD